MDFKLMIVWLSVCIKTVLCLDKDLSCAVCRALIDEVNYSISKVDPKKKIQVGSFRVDSKGNQGTYERPYARSEVHLLEIFEQICENFKHYAETTNSAGKKSIGRTEARDGKTLSLSNIKISAETGKLLKHGCESLIEEFEDDIISVFRKDHVPNIENVLCVETTDQCTEEDIRIPMPVTEYEGKDLPSKSEAEGESGSDGETDEELVNSFIQDNLDSQDSIPADTVIDHNTSPSSTNDQQREDL